MLRLTSLVFLALLAPALADEPTAPKMPPPLPEDAHVFAYGERNKACMEWTDGCQTCKRSTATASEAPFCSTPGIACTAKTISCTVKK